MKPSPRIMCVAALWLAAAPAAGQPAPAETKPLGDYSLHEFAAKWMVQHDDLAEISKYRDANQALIASTDRRPRVVLLGDSITFRWKAPDQPAAPGLNLVNRGIVGQNTTQMLLRFEDDVIALQPAAVVILGGANDLRAFVGEPQSAGERAAERMARNVTAMADIADARHVKVILCSVTPIGEGRRKDRDPAAILKINTWLRAFAQERGYPYVDYYVVLAGAGGELGPSLSEDGLHPNGEAYRLMRPRLEAAIRTLKLGR